ncbi:hypothetical protein [Blastococcus sp. TF02A-30]|uniref:hypothetical protein n=1 Tax=Blastococcus sp. TF02A-30 TaxID=2250580 RepID=UPI000DE840B9|nr:hypothetical protein [Blastococcus sp. TF02A-30]RBY91038.1 hypothetical protein DQ241_04995 [Blastococcus sp. TF02A-30]
MQDTPDSNEAAVSPTAETPTSALDSTEPSTVLAEVLPGIAVVFGDVLPELRKDLIDFGLVSSADRTQIATALAALGSGATIVGNVANAVASVQGLYRLADASQALLNAGGHLAIKDGANLGAIFGAQGGIVGQARFIPQAVTGAQMAAALGPALAAIALQVKLNEITGLVRTNIALTSQVLTSIRTEQWAELTGLVATIDRTVEQARELGSVPDSLWQSIAGSAAVLNKQRELYRDNVREHVRQIEGTDAAQRREYLQRNAEAIVFDAHALLSSLQAWTGYQALRAGKARTAGRNDPDEARLVDLIARDTQKELDPALAEIKGLVASLRHELRLLAELPGRGDSLVPSLLGWRKDAKAARQISVRLLEAITPLADALQPPAPALEAPDVVCAPESLGLEPYLRVLRWFLEDDETLRVLAFPDELDAGGSLSSLLGGAVDLLTWSDKSETRTLVAVTDRRIVTARTNAFLEEGELGGDIPLDDIRYVRAATTEAKNSRVAVDLITRDENVRWLFPASIENEQVGALASVLAESMAIPDAERQELRRRHLVAIEAGPDAAQVG